MPGRGKNSSLKKSKDSIVHGLSGFLLAPIKLLFALVTKTFKIFKPVVKKTKQQFPPLFGRFLLATLLIVLAGWIALPNSWTVNFQSLKNWSKQQNNPYLSQFFDNLPAAIAYEKIPLNLTKFGVPLDNTVELRKGLDLQGGTRVTLQADMSPIDQVNRSTALESAVEVLRRRVDLFGITEPNIQTVVFDDQYQILVELPGLDDPQTALQLIGQTAQLQFKIPPGEDIPEATASAVAYLQAFQDTPLTGELLDRAQVQFDPNTNQPVVGLQFNQQGAQLFADLTSQHIGQPIGIFLDNQPVTLPVVNEAIYGGQAVISGQFELTEAQTLATQLNAGALPVSIQVVEQETIGPILGEQSLQQSITAGAIGLLLVALFMILLYRGLGVIAVLGLIGYGLITIAAYKLIPVTLTLPGITGLILSIGMAVDANILAFEHIKEERRSHKNEAQAVRDGYRKSWEAIKDANLATLAICFILFNPLNWGFLNTSGPIRGFALTLALGIGVSLFTGVYYSRWLAELFWAKQSTEPTAKQPANRTKEQV